MLNAWDAVSALDRVVNDVRESAYGLATNARNYFPDVDFRADDNRIVVQCRVPGVKREDLEITLENRVLTLRGKRNYEKGGPNERVALGRSYGAFQQSFALPDEVDDQKLVARLADGILALEVPRHAKARTIPVVSGDGASESTLPTGDDHKPSFK